MRRSFGRLVWPIRALGVLALVVGARADGLSGVRVDVGPLIARGGGPQAEVLRADLMAALRANFADSLGGSGPTLVVRIHSLSLTTYAGGQGGRSGLGGGSQTDYLDGEALLVDRRGAVIGRHPQLSATPASFGGAWYDEASERRRVAAIAGHYAGWLRRAFPSAFDLATRAASRPD